MDNLIEESTTPPQLSDTEELVDMEYDSDSTNMSVSMGSQGSVNAGALEEDPVSEDEINEPESPVIGERIMMDGVVLSQRTGERVGTAGLEERSTYQEISLHEESASEERNEGHVAIVVSRGRQQTQSPVNPPSVSPTTEESTSIENPSELPDQPTVNDNLPVLNPMPSRSLSSLHEQNSEVTEPHQSQQDSSSHPEENDQPEAIAGPSNLVSSISRGDQSENTKELNEATPKKIESSSKKDPVSPESDDEGQICSICFEPWANSGAHRLASLKCGHIFGNSCIERWLKGQGGKCPQCNAKATKKDIRVLYAKSLKVIDTSERDRVVQELEKEREVRRKLELEHAQTKLQFELKSQLVTKLQNELKMLRNATASNSISSELGASSQGVSIENKNKLIIHSALDINKDGGCRVMAYNEWLNMVVVSMPSQVSMFPGCGVKKVNMLDVKSERYIPIHSKQLRDMAFNPAKNDLLLSVGMDKLVKLTNVCTNAPVGSFATESPLWSCCWNADHANQFFVGTATGSVLMYDTRNTDGPIKTIRVTGSGPVVSMCYIPFQASENSCTGGLLVARLSSCSFVMVKDDNIQDNALLLEGPFTSVSYEKSTRHFMVSCRPSQKYPHARHLVCELQSVNISSNPATHNKVISANIIQTFKGGTTQKVLSRSCLVAHPLKTGCILACASDESTQSTCLWDVSSGGCLQVLKCKETVIDIMLLKSNQSAFLALLTEKSVKFYKWVDVLS